MHRVQEHEMNIPKIILRIFLFLLNTSIAFAQQESGQATTGTGTIEPAGNALNEAAPNYIIIKSDNYIKYLVGNDYFSKQLTLIGNKSLQSGTGEISYNIFYLYNISSDYLISPNPKVVSVYLDKNGNIIDYIGPKEPYTFSITKEHAIEIAKQNSLKEPIIARIDRISASNSIDGYVWVVTGAIDKTTCREIGSTQECLIPGLYLDIDDGSVKGTFSSSNLILESNSNQIGNPLISNITREQSSNSNLNQQPSNNIFILTIGILILFIGIFITIYKFYSSK